MEITQINSLTKTGTTAPATTLPAVPPNPLDDPAVQSAVLEAFAVMAVSMMQQIYLTNRSMLNVYNNSDPSAGW